MWEGVVLATAMALSPGMPATVPAEAPSPIVSAPSSGSSAPGVVDAAIPVHPTLAKLASLATASGERLDAFLAHESALLADLMSHPPTAREVSRWWGALGMDARRTLLDATPALVGTLHGVPFSVRDTANRAHLAHSIRALEAELASGVGRGMSIDTRNTLSMLRRIDQALAVSPGEPRRSLVTLDTEWPGRAAIAVGNLSTADFVTYLIPGMFFTIEGQVGDWTDTATELYRDQEAWIERLRGPDDVTTPTIATVSWIGYRTPHLLNVGSLDLAYEAAEYFARDIDGLTELRRAAPPHVTVVAHSYGSTAAMISLARHAFEVDALAMVGSPGSLAQSAADLAVRGGNVFVGEAAWDPVVDSAFFGSDPGSSAFGAHRIAVSSGVDPLTRLTLEGASGHNGYFTPGSTSMRNLALIGIGRGDLASSESDGTIAAVAHR